MSSCDPFCHPDLKVLLHGIPLSSARLPWALVGRTGRRIGGVGVEEEEMPLVSKMKNDRVIGFRLRAKDWLKYMYFRVLD